MAVIDLNSNHISTEETDSTVPFLIGYLVFRKNSNIPVPPAGLLHTLTALLSAGF